MNGVDSGSAKQQREHALVAAVAAHMQSRFTEHTTHDGRAAFLNRLTSRPRRLWFLPTLAVGVVAAVAVMLVMPRPLTVVSKRVALDEQLNFSVGGTSAELTFSDGSQTLLQPGVVGSLTRLDSHGADFRLATGQIDIKVAKRPGARWSVLAGPYRVRVTGTHFQVRWLADVERFAIHMWEGHVVIEGPGLSNGRALSAGEDLELPFQSVALAEPQAKVDKQEKEENQDKPAVAAPEHRRNAAPPMPARVASPALGSQWQSFVAEGKYQKVLDDASRSGLARVLKHASLDELAALADAGRYGGNAHVAEQALLAQRKHFPHTERAVMAAYLLGRLSEDAGRPEAAVAWYERYLSAGSNTALAEESLGRKMLALDRAGLAAEAVKTARAYRQQYPNGSFFHAAERIEAIHSRQ